MNESTTSPAVSVSKAPVQPIHVTLGQIFRVFLIIGGISFGGGLIAYLRNSLVIKNRWIDDVTFVEMLSISQSLPGPYSVNVGILVGDRLRGFAGAMAAAVGFCLPGALFMFAVGVGYGVHGERPEVKAMLQGVAAAAVGLVTAIVVQIGRQSVKHLADLMFVALVIIGVYLLHLRVPYVFIGVGAVAFWWHRPRGATKAGLKP
jgi:chromate transporter